jgi:hypothetical protein
MKPNFRYTKDIGLAAYLKINNFPLEIKKDGKKGLFFYPKEAETEIVKYYADDGKHKAFAHAVRDLKSQVFNTVEEVTHG